MNNLQIAGAILSTIGFGLLVYFYGWVLAGIILLILAANNMEQRGSRK
jgi:hypothetical protein